MYREYSVSNELYSDTVKKLGAANRKIYHLKKQLSILKNSEVIASGKVEYKSGKAYLDSGVIKYTEHSGWLIGGTKIPKCYQSKLVGYNKQNIIISIEVKK